MRVRKLARELRRTPAEVLGILHELGYLRYQSSEDMVADAVVRRVRKTARESGPGPSHPLPATRAPAPAPRSPRAAASASAAQDLMAQLVPGVVRTPRKDADLPRRPKAKRGAEQPVPPAPAASAPRLDPAPDPMPGDARIEVEQARLEAQRARLEVERMAVEQLRGELEELRTELKQATADLALARDEVERAREELAAERSALAERPPEGVLLSEVFEARGLRGMDELQRALATLAEGRHLGPVLGELRITETHRLARILDDRLVLVGGAVPDALKGGAAVTVAPERADVPDARELGRRLDEVGEQLLLHGLRRAVIIGASPRWHRLLREGIDRRIELIFRMRPDPEGFEGGRGDAVLCWRAVLPDPLRQDLAMRQVVLIEVSEPGLEGFLVEVRDRLRGG